MAGKRQPVALVQAKGKKHLTKAEIDLRKAQELHPDADKVKPPAWMKSAKQKKRFMEVAEQLIRLEVMTNLDCEALARLIQAEDEYNQVTEVLEKMPYLVEVTIPETGPDGKFVKGEDGETVMKRVQVVNAERDNLDKVRERLWKRCRQGATDFGLTISGRCRLVAPKAREEKPDNKFAKYVKEKATGA